MKEYLPYGRQSVGPEEERRVRDVLQSDWLTQGPKVVEFEAALNRTCGSAHAVAVSHGTTALYLACRAAGLGPGDRFVTSPITFLATANAAVMCGARPVFVDIDPDTFDLDPAALDRALRRYRSVKVVLPVHLGGRVCDMEAIAAVCAEHGALVIEDACHAIGGRWRGSDGAWHAVGDGSHAAMTCFSFHPVKSVTTGEGGAVTTNDPVLAEKLRLLRNHGLTRDPEVIGEDADPWAYEMHALSFNGRLTDIQAALGVVQLEKLHRLKARRTALIRRYDAAFADLPGITCQARAEDDDACWHLAIVRTARRRALYDALLAAGIHSQVHYVPVHTQPYYRTQFGTGPGDCPVAEAYAAEALSLPLYPDLTDAEQDRVIDAVRAFQRTGDDV